MAEDQSVHALRVKLLLDNPEDFHKQMVRAYTMGNAIDQQHRALDNQQLTGAFKLLNEIRNRFRGIPGDNMSANQKFAINLTGEIGQVAGKIGDDIMKMMKTGVGIIEDIHTRLKQSSPLLQSVESLFNLAVQLFFMPLGNKLATVMIPAILELVDNVMDMWSKIEGMDLGEMLNEMISYGAEIFGKYFTHLGEELAEQTGLAGAIGGVLVGLGDFIENHLADLLEIVVNILSFIMDNLGTFIVLFMEFKIASLALQAATAGALIAGPIGGILAGVGVEIGGNYLASEAGVFDMAATMNRAASGAYVGATEGGRQVTVAEGGEGEFILPESRLQSMMDSVSDRMVDTAQAQPVIREEEKESSQVINNYFTINGYTDSQLRDIIRDTVNEQVSQSRLRSGF